MPNKRTLVPVTAFILMTVVANPSVSEDQLVVRNERAQVSIAYDGGGLVEFRFLDESTNPLNWEITPDLEAKPIGKPYLRGHFLCLDRWGPPSPAEIENGVPFHGEAPRIVWQATPSDAGALVGRMRCALPLAGLRVRRTVELHSTSAVLKVNEEVTNVNKRGRIFNMVQHPSIAPPFLDESTSVDSNASHGFWQDGALPVAAESADLWPKVGIDGRTVDLRRLHGMPNTTRSDVSSFIFDRSHEYGWVTACNAGKGVLLGYFWKTDEYPWLNIWRYIHNGQVAARGLEFGTTGLHQPFPALVKTNRILDRSLYEYADANQTVGKSYAVFLLKIPQDYRGVASVAYSSGQLRVKERGDANPRVLEMEVGELF